MNHQGFEEDHSHHLHSQEHNVDHEFEHLTVENQNKKEELSQEHNEYNEKEQNVYHGVDDHDLSSIKQHHEDHVHEYSVKHNDNNDDHNHHNKNMEHLNSQDKDHEH